MVKTRLTRNPERYLLKNLEEAEAEAPRIHDTTMNEEAQEEDREFEEP